MSMMPSCPWTWLHFSYSLDQMIAASWCYGYGLLFEWPEDWTGLLVGRQVNRTRAAFEV
jgi:hypothetical protein